jgi:hypothetical protein
VDAVASPGFLFNAPTKNSIVDAVPKAGQPNDDGLDTQGFIYEEPMDCYWTDKNRLDDLGPYNSERWDKMRCIHFILPNMTHTGQAATPRTARVPHYQTTLLEMKAEVAAFRAKGGKIKFKIYQPDKDYSNEFLHVVNSGVEGMGAIDWDALAKLADKKEKGDKNRQRKFKDFGTTAGQCTTRVGSSVGVAKPSYKPGTKDRCVVAAMLELCRYTKNAKFKWMPEGLRPFNCDDPDDERNKFAHRFHKDCFIPAARVGLTNIDQPCRYHCDDLNSQLFQYECVPTLSKIVVVNGKRSRCALIGYSRRSVDEYLVRAGLHRTYIEFVCDEYDSFEDERKQLSPSLFADGQPVLHSIPRFLVIKNPCNLDPWGHYSGFIEATLLLDRRFQLNLPERLSLLRAMAVTPNSAYLYVAAAASLLQRRQLDPEHRKEYRFGLLMAHTMCDIALRLKQEKRQLPPRRFNCYATYAVPGEKEWRKDCEQLLILHLTTPDTKLKIERQTAYNEVRQSLADIFPYVDVLGGNHLVAIAGTLGFLPLWVASEIEINKEGRPLKWLLTKFFEDKTERKKIKVDDVISNIMAALKTRYETDFTRRSVENIVCKVYRRYTENKSDSLFFDILMPDQNLYTVQANYVRVTLADGESKQKIKGSLLSSVPFHGSYVNSKELHSHLPKDWPGCDPKISTLGRGFLEGLFDTRRGVYPELPFEVSKRWTTNSWLSDKFVETERRLLS